MDVILVCGWLMCLEVSIALSEDGNLQFPKRRVLLRVVRCDIGKSPDKYRVIEKNERDLKPL